MQKDRDPIWILFVFVSSNSSTLYIVGYQATLTTVHVHKNKNSQLSLLFHKPEIRWQTNSQLMLELLVLKRASIDDQAKVSLQVCNTVDVTKSCSEILGKLTSSPGSFRRCF